MQKRDLITQYNLPPVVDFCKKCTISNQRPRITFDHEGVCSACRYAEFKRTKIDWKEREQELVRLLDKHRRSDGGFDVIVPCSGGKDGSSTAHILKYKYGMNPLAVTFSPQMRTDVGRLNLENFINSGFDHILATPNGKTYRTLSRLSFMELGDPFQPFIYGVTHFPLRMAVQYKVPLIMYGENGEVEYGGDMKNAFRPTRELADHDKHYFSGMPVDFWVKHGISPKELEHYLAPPLAEIQANKIEMHFMGYYRFWDPQENFYYCVQNTGFEPNPERNEGTYSKYASIDDKLDGFHYYLGFLKFGIGRATSDSAHEIRDGKITRDEGVALVRKFDGEFPKKYFKEFLEFVGLNEETFWQIADGWRSEHLWKKEGAEWKLRSAVWH